MESWSMASGAGPPSHFARENVEDSPPETISTAVFRQVLGVVFWTRAVRTGFARGWDGAGGAALATVGTRSRARATKEQARRIGKASVSDKVTQPRFRAKKAETP
jgi:hypothetical protein